jgi:hypothetical protein
MLRPPAFDCASQRERLASGSAPPGDAQRPCPFSVYPGHLVGASITMSMLAARLNVFYRSTHYPGSNWTNRLLHDVELTWTPDRPLGPLPPNAPDEVVRARESIDWNGPSLFTALQEQLGLKLEARRDKITGVAQALIGPSGRKRWTCKIPANVASSFSDPIWASRGMLSGLVRFCRLVQPPIPRAFF